MDIADHYFAPDEVQALAAATAIQRPFRFYEYWTFKESYIKARGMGLSLPLDGFSFHCADDQSVALALLGIAAIVGAIVPFGPLVVYIWLKRFETAHVTAKPAIDAAMESAAITD